MFQMTTIRSTPPSFASQKSSLHPGTYDQLIRDRGADYLREFEAQQAAAGKKQELPFSEVPQGLDLELGIQLSPEGIQDFDKTAFVHHGKVFIRQIGDGGFLLTKWYALADRPSA
jgi:hypothetical protein